MSPVPPSQPGNHILSDRSPLDSILTSQEASSSRLIETPRNMLNMLRGLLSLVSLVNPMFVPFYLIPSFIVASSHLKHIPLSRRLICKWHFTGHQNAMLSNSNWIAYGRASPGREESMPIEGMTNSSDWNKTAIKVNIKNVLQEGRGNGRRTSPPLDGWLWRFVSNCGDGR